MMFKSFARQREHHRAGSDRRMAEPISHPRRSNGATNAVSAW
jgi:hypothetical protein